MSNSTINAAGRLQKDLVYGEAGGETLRLDAFVPAGRGPFPVAVVLHGGGWSGGDKAGDTLPLCEALGEAGFVWLAPNYRLSPQHRWPACFEDVQTALAWVKANAARFGGDPERIALVGYSAGGQLACLAAMRDDAAAAVVLVAAPADLVADIKRRGELSPSLLALLPLDEVNPPVEGPLPADEMPPFVEAQLAAMSPLNFVRAGLPPFLLLHGTEDRSVPFAQSLALREALQAANVPCELLGIQDAPHRLVEWPRFDARYAGKMTAWLHKTVDGSQPRDRETEITPGRTLADEKLL